jgi:probable rRNA maturation factor
MSDGLEIAVEAEGWNASLPEAERLIGRAVTATLAAACPDIGPDLSWIGISLLLTDDGEIRRLNAEWRGFDKPTNVLSFPATETVAGEVPEPEFEGVPLELGDIALALETCRREAEDQGKRLGDHVVHLTVHGVLHLLGYDHLVDDEAEIMEALEVRILAGLGIADPYADGRPPDGAIDG